jgi:hypothetical protein
VTASIWTKEEDVSDVLPNTQGVAEVDKKVAIQKVANRLGTTWQKAKTCSGKASLLIRFGGKYSPFKGKQRSDCSREAAYVAVHEFCHCNESSNLDTESYQFVKVKHQYSGEVETHPFRVWHELTLKDRYKTFLESSAFKKFKEEHPSWDIGKEVFRQLICKCVRGPGPQSCVDLHMSQLKHYMSAFDKAMKNNPVIKGGLTRVMIVSVTNLKGMPAVTMMQKRLHPSCGRHIYRDGQSTISKRPAAHARRSQCFAMRLVEKNLHHECFVGGVHISLYSNSKMTRLHLLLRLVKPPGSRFFHL